MAKPDLFEVLVHYGWSPPMPRSGWQSIRCEVHGDHNASARINYDLEKLHCFACGFRGDSYDVIQYHEGVDFARAKRIGESFAQSSGGEIQHGSAGVASRALPGWSGHRPSDKPYLPSWLRR